MLRSRVALAAADSSGTGYSFVASTGALTVKNNGGTTAWRRDTTSDSKPQEITVTKAEAPTNLTAVSVTGGANNGKIVGTTDKMEYSGDSAFTNPIACTATETTGLAAGNYYVRVKATGTVLASNAATVHPRPSSLPSPPSPSP